MQRILKKSKCLFIALVFVNISLFGQDLKTCEIRKVEGLFAYEASFDLWSEDDMIYRRASLFSLENDTVAFKRGLFAFEYGVDVPKYCITPETEKAIKYFSGSLNDSIHSHIEGLNTKVLNTKEGKYKCIFLSMDVMFIRNEKIRIKEGANFFEKLLPLYLVLNFNYIRPY